MATEKNKKMLKEMLPEDAVTKVRGSKRVRPFLLVIERTEKSPVGFSWEMLGHKTKKRYSTIRGALDAYSAELPWIQNSFLYGVNPKVSLINERTGVCYNHLLTGETNIVKH